MERWPRHFENMKFVEGVGYLPEHDEGTMARLNQIELERTILSKQWTYTELCVHFNADNTQKMQIDRTLQKLRRKNLISLKRRRRLCIWTPVPQNPLDAIEQQSLPPGTGPV